MIHQRTLNAAVSAVGVGLHSGQRARLVIRPAPANMGIVFKRTDLPDGPCIAATAENVVSTNLCTVLGSAGVEVSTVEHLMSAFAGLGVDNAFVELNTQELPILDGSSAPFVDMMSAIGLRKQDAFKRYIKIIRPITIDYEDKRASLSPFDGFKLTYHLSYDHPFFENMPSTVEVDLDKSSYADEVCRARTYGFLADYEKLRQANLAQGGSLDNAVVIGDKHILNTDGLRYCDEPGRHKILDAIGDLYLLGHRLIGAFEGYKSGHALNHALIKALLDKPSHWQFMHFADDIGEMTSWLRGHKVTTIDHTLLTCPNPWKP